jgi:hypothetical protein
MYVAQAIKPILRLRRALVKYFTTSGARLPSTVTRLLCFRALHREACAFEAPTNWRRADKKPALPNTGAFLSE